MAALPTRATPVDAAAEPGDGWPGGAVRGLPALRARADHVRPPRPGRCLGRPPTDPLKTDTGRQYGFGLPRASRASLRRYYGFLGDRTEGIVESAIRSPDAVKDTVWAFGEIGMTELLFVPTVPSVDEVDRLADAVL